MYTWYTFRWIGIPRTISANAVFDANQLVSVVAVVVALAANNFRVTVGGIVNWVARTWIVRIDRVDTRTHR